MITARPRKPGSAANAPVTRPASSETSRARTFTPPRFPTVYVSVNVGELWREMARGRRRTATTRRTAPATNGRRSRGPAAARAARDYFETRHQKKLLPSDIKKQFDAPESIWICRLLVDLEFAKSSSEARRLISQGAVRVDGQTLGDVNFQFRGTEHEVVEVGKNRIARVKRI